MQCVSEMILIALAPTFFHSSVIVAPTLSSTMTIMVLENELSRSITSFQQVQAETAYTSIPAELQDQDLRIKFYR